MVGLQGARLEEVCLPNCFCKTVVNIMENDISLVMDQATGMHCNRVTLDWRTMPTTNANHTSTHYKILLNSSTIFNSF